MKAWEVSMSEWQSQEGKRYKVTRRMPELSMAETKIFDSKDKARMQFEEWLGEWQ